MTKNPSLSYTGHALRCIVCGNLENLYACGENDEGTSTDCGGDISAGKVVCAKAVCGNLVQRMCSYMPEGQTDQCKTDVSMSIKLFRPCALVIMAYVFISNTIKGQNIADTPCFESFKFFPHSHLI